MQYIVKGNITECCAAAAIATALHTGRLSSNDKARSPAQWTLEDAFGVVLCSHRHCAQYTGIHLYDKTHQFVTKHKFDLLVAN